MTTIIEIVDMTKKSKPMKNLNISEKIRDLFLLQMKRLLKSMKYSLNFCGMDLNGI